PRAVACTVPNLHMRVVCSSRIRSITEAVTAATIFCWHSQLTGSRNTKIMAAMNRRTFLAAAVGGAALRQQPPQVSSTPSTRDFNRQDPVQYPDPDIIALDNRFRRYIVVNTVIRRLHFGTLWAEGPAWNGVGRYLVWSDIPNNVQMRWIEEDGRVTVFRNPSGYSNGNTFDFEGRQLSCEHGGRRVVRYEPNGTVTVIAEKYQGKR